MPDKTNGTSEKAKERLLDCENAVNAFAAHVSKAEEGDWIAFRIPELVWVFSITLPIDSGINLEKEIALQHRMPSSIFNTESREFTLILGEDGALSRLMNLTRNERETNESYKSILDAFAAHFSRAREGDWVTSYIPGLWMFSITLLEGVSDLLEKEMALQRRTPSIIFTPEYGELTAILAEDGLLSSLKSFIRNDSKDNMISKFNENKEIAFRYII